MRLAAVVAALAAVAALRPQPRAARRKSVFLRAHHRHFVVASPNASAAVRSGAFSPNNLLEGRVDVLCRCQTAALWYSNGVRADATLWLALGSDVSVGVAGARVRGLAPDEKTFALQLRGALVDRGDDADDAAGLSDDLVGPGVDPAPDDAAGRGKDDEGLGGNAADRGGNAALDRADGDDAPDRAAGKSQRNLVKRLARAAAKRLAALPPAPAGFEVRRNETLEALVARLRPAEVVILDEGAPPFDAAGEGVVVVVVADQSGFEPGAAERLATRLGGTRRSLGERSLLSSQCVLLANHRLDVAAEEAKQRLEEAEEVTRAARARTKRFKAEKRQDRLVAADNELLARLVSGGDPYDASSFTSAHAAFKRRQNEVFVDLARRFIGEDSKVFILDGADAETTRALLRSGGVAADRIVCANPFPDTAAALRNSGITVVERRAEDWLPAAAERFAALYPPRRRSLAPPFLAVAAPRNIHVPAAASPRPASMEFPPGTSTDVAARRSR